MTDSKPARNVGTGGSVGTVGDRKGNEILWQRLGAFLEAHPRVLDLVLAPGRESRGGETVTMILAISGGKDSMLLLHLVSRLHQQQLLKCQPVVFHLDHGLREDSSSDEELVASRARELDLPYDSVRRDVAVMARRLGRGVEETGRLLRYRSLGRLGRQFASAVAMLGHHADDYVESLLMHMIRGGGPASWQTMDTVEVLDGLPVVRPLMPLSRQDIDIIVEDAGIVYREDTSNHSSQYLRNRLRHRVIPLLQTEGLQAAHLWEVYHDRVEDWPLPVGQGKKRGWVFLDERLFVGQESKLGARDWKATLDIAMKALALPPVDRPFLREVARQLRANQGSLRVDGSGFRLWKPQKGAIQIYRNDASVFLLPQIQPELEQQKRGRGNLEQGGADRKEYQEFTVEWAGAIRSYAFRNGRYPATWKPGQRAAHAAEGQAMHSKQMKKVFQESGIPVFLRDKIPVVYDPGLDLVCGVLLSFLDDRRDAFFC